MQPTWITSVLRAAGLYNLLWGTLVVFFPLAAFDWAGMPRPNYPELWQCIGMIVGVYGIGYWIAARDVARHWPIVLVGLLGKVFGPIGMAIAIYRGALPPAAGLVSLFNDLVWWVPFCAALWYAFKANSAAKVDPANATTDPLSSLLSQQGQSLWEISHHKPVLVTFLRHSGCAFCREALADLSRCRASIEGAGLQLALVHMSSEKDAAELTARYQLEDVARFSDPQQQLYRAFELGRGKFHQLLGPAIWWRGFLAAIVARHGFNRIQGDGFQMPGVFVIDRGRIVASYRHQTAADRPDYCGIAAEACARS